MSHQPWLERAHSVEIRMDAKRVLAQLKILKVAETQLIANDPGALPLSLGDIVNATITSKTGICAFESKVLGRQWIPGQVLVFSLPQGLEQKQRRQDVRIDVRLPMIFAYPPKYGVPQAAGWVAAQCRTIDLSVGGLQAEVENAKPPIGPQPSTDGIGELRLVPAQPPLTCHLRILRSGPGGGPGRFRFTARFLGLPMADETRISKFVFAAQAAQRRGGAG